LIVLAHRERHAEGPLGRRVCVTCGARVSCYTSSPTLHALRPEAVDWDWWVACDNAACPHSYGEGEFQGAPDWVRAL
jgi:hypothetical protein